MRLNTGRKFNVGAEGSYISVESLNKFCDQVEKWKRDSKELHWIKQIRQHGKIINP